MPSLLVCALLGLAVAVLLDVARAPGPAARIVETPVLIIGLDKLRELRGLRRPNRRPRGTPTVFLELPEISGELDSGEHRPQRDERELPSVIVE